MSAVDAGGGSRAIAGQHAPLYFSSADPIQEPMPAEKVSRKAVSPVTAGSSKGWTSAACAAVATAAIATPVASSFMLMSRACVGASQECRGAALSQFSLSHDEKPPKRVVVVAMRHSTNQVREPTLATRANTKRDAGLETSPRRAT